MSKKLFKNYGALVAARRLYKNILLNFYITEILLFSEYLQKCFQVQKRNDEQMLNKNSVLINASYLKLDLKMGSSANIFQSTTNAEQLFYKTKGLRDSSQVVFFILRNIEQCLISRDSPEWLVSHRFFFWFMQCANN